MMGLTRKRRRPADPNALRKCVDKATAQTVTLKLKLCATADCQRKLKRALLPCRITTSRATKSRTAASVSTQSSLKARTCPPANHLPPGSQKPTKNSSRHAPRLLRDLRQFPGRNQPGKFLDRPGGQFHVPVPIIIR